jgi:HAD superfamily hydrolase (TIGR01509 family)
VIDCLPVEAITAILFDWDGTLLDSFPSSYEASIAVFQHFGIRIDRERFFATYNPNWYQTYRSVGLPEESWKEADRVWREAYRRKKPDLFSFTQPTLEMLQTHGYDLGLVTSGDRERVSMELEQYGLVDVFSARVFCEDTQEKKPHPAPLRVALDRMNKKASESVYVGDRPEDILMGRETGAYTVGVKSDFVTHQELEAASPDWVLPDAGHLTTRFGPILDCDD